MTLRTDSPAELRRTFRILGHVGLWLLASFMWGHGGYDHRWVYVLLTFAAFFLMPLGDELLAARGVLPERQVALFIVLLFLILALMQTPSLNAALYSTPWLVMRTILAMQALWRWNRHRSPAPADLCLLAAATFPAVGAAWLVAFCAGWMPFGFDALIVLLTAAHFHHAGFTLPLIAGLIARDRPSQWTSWSCIAVLSGVPLVATGITCTHFGWLPWVEPLGVTLLVIGALGVALSQMRLGLESAPSSWPHTAFLISGTSLLIAMLLALGFGLRYLVPSLALPMPQMWAIHGSLNAFVFGLFGLLAWRARS
jgi:hypothetical protein